MKKDLHSHIKKYKLLSSDVCQEITEQLDASGGWEQHRYHNSSNDTYINNGEQELSVAWHNTIIGYNMVMDTIFKGIYQYVSEIKYPWYDSWSGYTSVRWNRYNQGTKMNLHCDHIQTMFDGIRKGIPTLSVLGILNDNFEGGDLVFFEDEVYKTEVGDIIIFPSNFLYPHHVTTVTKGTRYSFVSWVW